MRWSRNQIFLFCFVLFCFVLFCFVLFCFVLFCFVLLLFHLFVTQIREKNWCFPAEQRKKRFYQNSHRMSLKRQTKESDQNSKQL